MISENPASKKCRRDGCGVIMLAGNYPTMHQFARTKYCCAECATADRETWHTRGKSRQFSVGDISRPVVPCMFCGRPSTSRLAGHPEVAACEECESRLYREVLAKREATFTVAR